MQLVSVRESLSVGRQPRKKNAARNKALASFPAAEKQPENQINGSSVMSNLAGNNPVTASEKNSIDA